MAARAKNSASRGTSNGPAGWLPCTMAVPKELLLHRSKRRRHRWILRTKEYLEIRSSYTGISIVRSRNNVVDILGRCATISTATDNFGRWVAHGPQLHRILLQIVIWKASCHIETAEEFPKRLTLSKDHKRIDAILQ